MKKLLLLTAVLLLPFIVFSQHKAREILHGRVVADSLDTDNITVYNTSSRIGAVTDSKGEFTLYARATDTLLFSSITFRSLHLVLQPEDLMQNPLAVRLDVNINTLDEVVISPHVLTGDLKEDSKKIKVQTIGSGFDANALIKTAPPKYTIVNPSIAQQESAIQGINFAKLYRDIFKKKKKKDKGDAEGAQTTKSFADAVKERFTYYFFTETLKIPKDEIGAFVVYADPGAAAAGLLDPKNEFQLTDYLIGKGADYLKNKKE